MVLAHANACVQFRYLDYCLHCTGRLPVHLMIAMPLALLPVLLFERVDENEQD